MHRGLINGRHVVIAAVSVDYANHGYARGRSLKQRLKGTRLIQLASLPPKGKPWPKLGGPSDRPDRDDGQSPFKASFEVPTLYIRRVRSHFLHKHGQEHRLAKLAAESDVHLDPLKRLHEWIKLRL